MSMLSFENLSFTYEPFPIGRASAVVEPVFYRELAATYPDRELFEFQPSHGNKYSLSEVNNPREYHEFIAKSPAWRRFHAWVKQPSFSRDMLALLCTHHIDLGIRVSGKASRLDGLRRRFDLLRGRNASRLSTRFEFSMLPADGGYIRPHTDSPQKLVTLVVSMRNADEWQPHYGGATEMLRPKDSKQSFNFVNRYLEFEDCETLKAFDYVANNCTVFIKTFNSLHCVRPMLGAGSREMRKTLTINIEQLS
jgi:hypothetical protein